MSTLQSELSRLYLCDKLIVVGSPETQPSFVDRDGRVRAMVLELSRPADWKLMSSVWNGVQTDFELPAPAIAVNGVDGYQLWFSVAEAVLVDEAITFLEVLRRRYLNTVNPERIALSPSLGATPPSSFHHAGMVPTQCQKTGFWSAFVAPDLAAIFSEEPWLDVPPNGEAQASILAQLQCIQPDRFKAVISSLRFGKVPEIASPAPRPLPPGTGNGGDGRVTLSASGQTPLQFLLEVMNDSTVDLHLRIEAAKALLPFYRRKPD